MQWYKVIFLRQGLHKRVYGFIAFLLLFAFIGRVSVICINGGISVVKTQQTNVEDNQEQNDKQEESKFDNKQLTEFISPNFAHLQLVPVVPVIVGYPVCLLPSVKMPLLTVVTPPPDFLFS
jgi:hypothetical protein